MPKTVLVTGASRGIGRECAKAFAREGFNVLINYHKSGDAANALKRELCEMGVRTEAFCADVSDTSEVERMFERIETCFGGVDVLVNNAGVAHTALFSDVSDAQRDRIFGVNVFGAFNCVRAALPYMIHEKSGSIINISSIWGVSGASCEVHYSASKAALIGFTRALSKELAPSGIRVNCVAPGVIDTDMNAALDGNVRAQLCEDTPLGRLGTPEEAANAVLFLASDRASFITGQTITVDGGFIV